MLYIDFENEDGTEETLEMPTANIYFICKTCGKKQYYAINYRCYDDKGNDLTDNMLCDACEAEMQNAMVEKKRLRYCKKHGLPEVWTENTLKDYLARKSK